MERRASVSVIVPAKNAEETIAYTLASVLRQTVKPLEVIVVDGGSTDNTVGVALRFSRFGVRVIREPPHEGRVPAIGRNFGAKHARGDVLLFVDPDVILPPTLIERALYFLSRPRVAVYAAVVSDGTGYHVSRAWHCLQRMHSYDFAPSRVMAVWKRVFEEVGGFDKSLPAGEDNDFSYKVLARGYKIVVDKSVEVPHIDDHAMSFKSIYRVLKWYREGYRRLVEKYGHRFGGTGGFRIGDVVRLHLVPILRCLAREGVAVGLDCAIIKAMGLLRRV